VMERRHSGRVGGVHVRPSFDQKLRALALFLVGRDVQRRRASSVTARARCDDTTTKVTLSLASCASLRMEGKGSRAWR
jgi:hypothetical protein